MPTIDELIDISHGKPFSELLITSQEVYITEITIDLLWFYQFDRVILDQWGNPSLPGTFEYSAQADEEAKLPVESISFSADGETFTSAEPSKVLISSVRGSRGTKRSYIVWFDTKKARGRFVRMRYRAYGPMFKLRILLPLTRVKAFESSKMIQAYGKRVIKNNAQQYNAAVIGGSNSVMRYGWVKGLSQAEVSVNQNVSLGASQMTMLASRLAELDGTNVDVLFFNTVVNEYRPMQYESYDRNLAKDAIRQGLVWCKANDVLPVFLIWPQLHYMRDEKVGQTKFNPRDHYRDICEDFGIPYIDCYELLHKVADGWNRPVSTLFLDDAHTLHHVAQVLGASVRGASVKLIERIDKQIGAINSTSPSVASLEAVLLEETLESPAEYKIREVSTSLISRLMLTIEEGNPLEVRIHDDWEVVGFMINARNCNGSIEITGEVVQTVRADFSKYLGEDGFPFVCVRSLQTPVTPKDGVIKISCVNPEPWHQPDELAGKTLSTVSIGDTRHIEIAELIIRSKVPMTSAMRVGINKLDLTDDCLLDFALSSPNSASESNDASWT